MSEFNQLAASEQQTNPLAIVETIDAQTVQATLQKIAQFQAVVQHALAPGKDYGRIPGAGDKPSLFKPGAEKINMLFGLNPVYEFLKADEDYLNGFFNYDIKCTLMKNGNPVAQGVGNCNSKEKKYRYVTVFENQLAEYGQTADTAIKMTDKYGKTKYRIPNTEIYSLTNTILKMAKKRAYVDATLQVASLSDLFTQDLEDMDFQQQEESTSTMTVAEAANITLSFGKHKGQKLGEMFHDKDGRSYLAWLKKNENGKTSPTILKAIELLENAVKEKKAEKTHTAKDDDWVPPPDSPTSEQDSPDSGNADFVETGAESDEKLPF